MEFYLVLLLNGIGYGLLLFMLSAGLTVIFGMLGVLNFAHASFYMLGAYLAFSFSARAGFWAALILAPLCTAVLGALFERFFLRSLRGAGHLAELLATFGLSYVILELVQLAWGQGVVDYPVPRVLEGTLATVGGMRFPIYRAFMMLLSVAMLGAIWLLLVRTRAGLAIRAAASHPQALEALGHDVPRIFTLVFGGGCALAGLAGVIGGNTYVTEPGMAVSVGAVVFVVVVVGGLGSLPGAFAASLLLGTLQTLVVAIDAPLASLLGRVGLALPLDMAAQAPWRLRPSQFAPILPYVLLVLVLVVRPRGLFGRQEL